VDQKRRPYSNESQEMKLDKRFYGPWSNKSKLRKDAKTLKMRPATLRKLAAKNRKVEGEWLRLQQIQWVKDWKSGKGFK